MLIKWGVNMKKTCEQLIDNQLEMRIQDLTNISLLDDPDLPFKDLIKTIEDNGYSWKEYVIIHKNKDHVLGLVERDLDLLTDLKYQILNEYPLNIECNPGSVKIELSWGGPQDYFILYPNEGTYHYLDWFDGAVKELDPDQHSLIYDLFGYLFGL